MAGLGASSGCVATQASLDDLEATVTTPCEECDTIEQTTGDGSGAFVGRRGLDFYLNGRPFKHVGVNAALLYQPMDQVVFTLDQLQIAGVKHVRFGLPDQAMNGNNWDPAEIKNRLKAVLDAALARDIRATLIFGAPFLVNASTWEGRNGLAIMYGDESFYTRPVALPHGLTLWMVNDSWIDWGYQRGGGSYKDFVWNVVASFKNHPGVFAWEIANEINVSNTSNSWLVGRELAFYKEMAALIKATDPNHLVAPGIISTQWAGLTTDALRDSLYKDPNIDYVTVHEYDDGTPQDPNDNEENNLGQKEDIRRANERWNKPVIIEEFGMTGENTFERVKAYYAKHYAGDPAYQVDAIMVFSMQYSCPQIGGPDWNSGHGLYGPCEQNLIRPYMGLWARWVGQVDPTAPLVIDNYYVNNDASRTQLIGSASVWTPSTYSPQYWGTGYMFSTANGGATGESDAFEYRFHLPSAACKAIDGWWNGNSSRSAAVPYVAFDTSGQKLGDTMYANQQINSDRWVEVGRRCFSAGWNTVKISRWTNVPGYIIADAIRMRD